MNYDLKMFVLVALDNGSMRRMICRLVLRIKAGLDTGSSAKLREFKMPLVWRIVAARAKHVTEVIEQELGFRTICEFQSHLDERHMAVT